MRRHNNKQDVFVKHHAPAKGLHVFLDSFGVTGKC